MTTDTQQPQSLDEVITAGTGGRKPPRAPLIDPADRPAPELLRAQRERANRKRGGWNRTRR